MVHSFSSYIIQNDSSKITQDELKSFARGNQLEGLLYGSIARICSFASIGTTTIRTFTQIPTYGIKLYGIASSNDSLLSKTQRIALSISSISLACIIEIGVGLLGTLSPELTYGIFPAHEIPLFLKCYAAAQTVSLSNNRSRFLCHSSLCGTMFSRIHRQLENFPPYYFSPQTLSLCHMAQELYNTPANTTERSHTAPNFEPEIPANFFDPVFVNRPIVTKFTEYLLASVQRWASGLVHAKIFTKDEMEEMTESLPAVLNRAIFDTVRSLLREDISPNLRFGEERLTERNFGPLYTHIPAMRTILQLSSQIPEPEIRKLELLLSADEERRSRLGINTGPQSPHCKEIFQAIVNIRTRYVEKHMIENSEQWLRAFQQ